MKSILALTSAQAKAHISPFAATTAHAPFFSAFTFAPASKTIPRSA
jgi:hypothetical protein